MDSARKLFTSCLYLLAGWLTGMMLLPQFPGLWPFMWALVVAPLMVRELLFEVRSRKLLKNTIRTEELDREWHQ